jgi:ubiquinone/menaquinone biosynthesis C-methylase UbiE
METNNGIMARTGKWEKLESPQRAKALSPEETLKKIGLDGSETICDIGAGSGLFARAAARMTSGPVYALDIDAEILEKLREKAETEGLANIKPVAISDFSYPLASNSIDLVLMVTVLHEIDQKDLLLTEIRRILKPSGRVVIVEFRKEDTPMGPPPVHRIAADAVKALFTGNGFDLLQDFLVGDDFYCQSYRIKK